MQTSTMTPTTQRHRTSFLTSPTTTSTSAYPLTLSTLTFMTAHFKVSAGSRSVRSRSVGSRRGRGVLRVAGATFASLLLLFGFALAAATPAAAHAEIVSTSPAAGATVAEPVESVELRWNEIVNTGADQLKLYSSSGELATVDVTVTDFEGQTNATIIPREALDVGTWVVTWKVVSADGHLIAGSLPFTVSDGITAPLVGGSIEGSSSADRSATTSSVRSNDVSSLNGFEVPLGSDGPLDRTTETLSWLTLMVAAAALLTRRGSLVLVAAVTTVALATARSVQISTDFGSGLFSTGEARAAAAVASGGLVALLFLAVAATFGWAAITASTAGRTVIVGTIAVSFAAQAYFSGHHLDLDGAAKPVATVAHASHLVAVFVWVVAVAAAFMDRTVLQLRRTRTAATWSIGVLLLAGPLLSFLLLFPGGVDLDSPWVLLFSAKVAMIVAAAALGWLHHRRSGNLTADNTDPSRWGRTLGAEIVVFMIIAALSATLTMHRPPALDAPQSPRDSNSNTAESNTPELNTAGETLELRFSGGSTATLTIADSSAATASTWTLELRGPDGTAVDVDKITVEAANTERDIVGVDVTLLPVAAGRYEAVNTLPVPGTWQLHISYLLDQFTLEHAMATLTTPSNESPTPGVGTERTS
jgi:copper transport protein